MTPYLAQVRDRQGTESQLCCVLLAERVHSGYEGNSWPRPLPHFLPWFRYMSVRWAPGPCPSPASGRASISLKTWHPPLSPGPPCSPIHTTSPCQLKALGPGISHLGPARR